MNDVLREIVAATRADLARRQPVRVAAGTRERGRFARALQRGITPRIIAEIKAASPSAGAIAPDPDVEKIARSYRRGGASAISVVTEPRFFHGSIEWVRTASTAAGLPVLMKDFVVDPVQIHEAAAAGADAVLLIAAILSPGDLQRFIAVAEGLGIDPVVEVHDAAELSSALAAGARIIGVNNRNLRSFEVDLSTAERLAAMIPPSAIRIAESGIRSRADVGRLRRAGFNNFLVGEWLLRSGDAVQAVRELRGLTGPAVKICGITRIEDALTAADAGARFLGLVFADGSPRRIDAARGRKIREALPPHVAAVGVFRNQPVDEIRRVAEEVQLDYVQLHGDESPQQVEQMRVPVIKALAVHSYVPDSSPYRAADWLLFDACSPGAGQQFDWKLLHDVQHDQPFFLAGGLNPTNVAAAVNVVNPDAIDVASGVESAPGIKNADKIRALFEALKS